MIGEQHEYFDTHRFGAQWIVDNISKPKNIYLQTDEHKDFISAGEEYSGYRTLFYGSNFLYSENPVEVRRGLINSYPYDELVYNPCLDPNISDPIYGQNPPEVCWDTYGLPTVVTNCSNNYGPYQFPEKLIPLFINNIRHGKPLPVYGKGENVRDWLYVEDHARAIDLIFHEGKIAETYNIGGFNEWKNIDIIHVVIKTVDRLLGNPEGHSLDLITYVTDRAGHDLRYAIDSTKLQRELGWEPSLQFEEGIELTVRWYLDNQEWLENVTSGDYQAYYEKMYAKR